VDFWTLFWLAWGIALVADLVAAKMGHGSTLSEHIWGRWFLWPWGRIVFLIFWLVCWFHFAFAGHGWLASGWMVAVWGLACGAIVAEREASLRGKEFGMGGIASKVWNGLKVAGGWVARHGPVFSSAILGVSFAFPALKPVAIALGGMLAGTGTSDPDLAKLVGELILGVISLLGVFRKVMGKIKQ
jgi:hypothetical protein